MVIGRAIDGNSSGILNERFFMFPCHPDRSKEREYARGEEKTYFFIAFCTRYKKSAENTEILCADSACSINCLMISRSVVPVALKEQFIPRSLQWSDPMKT